MINKSTVYLFCISIIFHSYTFYSKESSNFNLNKNQSSILEKSGQKNNKINTEINFDFSKYANVFAEMTTDGSGDLGKRDIKDYTQNLQWKKDKKGYFLTKDLEYEESIAYKVLARNENNWLIATEFVNGAGRMYTSLYLVETMEDILDIKSYIAGGQKCHGLVNLDKIHVKNQTISYSTNITHNSLMTWFAAENKDIGFSDCFTCCIGEANFQYDLKQKKNIFKSVIIFEENIEGPKYEDKALEQIYKQYTANQKDKSTLELNEKELHTFILDIAQVMLEEKAK